MWETSPNAFSVEQSARQSHSVLFVRFKRLRRQRERKQKFQTRMTFSLTKGGRFFLILVQKSSFRRCWSVLLFHRSKKKKKFCRERETWQLKRERFSFLVETSRTQKSRIITHHNRSSFFSVIQRHFSATPLFVSERKREIQRRRNNVVSFCSFFSRRGLHVLVVAS